MRQRPDGACKGPRSTKLGLKSVQKLVLQKRQNTVEAAVAEKLKRATERDLQVPQKEAEEKDEDEDHGGQPQPSHVYTPKPNSKQKKTTAPKAKSSPVPKQ